MNNGEVKRWMIPNRKDDFGFHIAIEKDSFMDEHGYGGCTEVMPVEDHERIVAELRAEVARASRGANSTTGECMSNDKVKLGLYMTTGRRHGQTFRAIRDMVEKLLPSGEIKVTTPDMQDLERTVAGLKEELEVFRNREYSFENELELKQTIATQKRVIEKLREQRDIELEDNCWDDALTGGRPFEQTRAMMDAEIEAMNKLEDLKKL